MRGLDDITRGEITAAYVLIGIVVAIWSLGLWKLAELICK